MVQEGIHAKEIVTPWLFSLLFIASFFVVGAIYWQIWLCLRNKRRSRVVERLKTQRLRIQIHPLEVPTEQNSTLDECQNYEETTPLLFSRSAKVFDKDLLSPPRISDLDFAFAGQRLP